MEIALIPRFIVRKFFSSEADQIHANILLTHLFILFCLIILPGYLVQSSSSYGFCIFKKIFDIPCPGCGITRSLLNIASGDIYSAWKFNPAGVFLFLYLFTQIPLRMVALKAHSLQARVSQISQWGSKVVLAILILVWILRII